MSAAPPPLSPDETRRSGSVESYSLGKGPPRRFRRRVFFYLLTLSLATSTASGAAFYARQVKFIEKDRARRAGTLLTSLATQTELGAYAGDAALCELPARRTFKEEDVVFVGLYDAKGKEFLRMSSPTVATLPPVPKDALAAFAIDPDAPTLRLPGDGYEDLWAPIVTTARPAAAALSTEPGGAAARREVVGLARVGLSLTPAQEQLDEVLRTGAYLSFGLLVLGALAAILIAGRISDPILALARGADEIRAGNLDVTIEAKSSDEIGLLAESFNRMALRLRETMAALETLNRNLEGEVMRRTDEIRRSAEFTQVLNAPIERGAGVSGDGVQHPELTKLLDDALRSLLAGAGVRAAAVMLPVEEAVEFELYPAATLGAEANGFGSLPTRSDLADGHPRLATLPGGEERATVPLLFRGQPEGAIVLRDAAIASHSVDFTQRAAGQLAIAIANARAYATLEHLASELTERNGALVKQRDQLQEMNRLKSEFLANISHELRTPLNAILGYSELINEEVYGPVTPEQKEGLGGIEESSRNLLILINQILDLSKVESGKMEVYVTEVAVHDVAQSVVAETQVLTKERPYKVTVSSPTRVVVKTDQSKVHQILTNLIANAVKFTEKGSVTVTVRAAADGGCDLIVRDTGIGIKKSDQQLIFEEFRQVDGSSTRRHGGTGLGLAIARRFAVLLSGNITVESELGKGSTFTLHLPPEPRAPARPPPVPARASSSRIEVVKPSAPGRGR